MLFITLFELYFKPWEACLPRDVLLEFIDILEKIAAATADDDIVTCGSVN